MFLRFFDRLRRPIARHGWVDKLTPEQRAALTDNLQALLQSKTVIERDAGKRVYRPVSHSASPGDSASGSPASGPNRSPGATR